MTKAQEAKDRWISDVQMFQRIARVPETSYEELAREWDGFNEKRRLREQAHIETHRVIQDACTKKD